MAKLRDYCNPDELVLGCVLDWMREETIDFLGAPFEAEWQLAKMEKDGRIDAVLTTDGDAIILQCESVYFDFDPSKKEWREYKKANILSGSYPLSAYHNHGTGQSLQIFWDLTTMLASKTWVSRKYSMIY